MQHAQGTPEHIRETQLEEKKETKKKKRTRK
jgi:hypothetical protein